MISMLSKSSAIPLTELSGVQNGLKAQETITSPLFGFNHWLIDPLRNRSAVGMSLDCLEQLRPLWGRVRSKIDGGGSAWQCRFGDECGMTRLLRSTWLVVESDLSNGSTRLGAGRFLRHIFGSRFILPLVYSRRGGNDASSIFSVSCFT